MNTEDIDEIYEKMIEYIYKHRIDRESEWAYANLETVINECLVYVIKEKDLREPKI